MVAEKKVGVQPNVNSGNRLTMVHTGGIIGFLHNAALTYKYKSATGNYHGQMNAANFEKQLVEKPIPYLHTQYIIGILSLTPD
jgi:hypothetical protein